MGNVSKLFVGGFKWEKSMLKFNEKFIKNYNKDSNKGYILEEDVEYCKYLHYLHSDLPFLPERMKSNKCNKLVCTQHNKKLCRSYKIFKTSIKPCINTKKNT